MSNFAKIGINNIVLAVEHINNISSMTPDGVEVEEIGVEFLKKIFGHESWLKCSYNTSRGIYRDQITGELNKKEPFRKNYPSPGWFYDNEIDGFIPPKPYSSWILNKEEGWWYPPIPKPEDENKYIWNEESTSWKII